MNAIYTPSLQLALVIIVFAGAYLTYVVRKLLCGKIDLYDFLMLSTLAGIPALFVLWPGFTTFVARAFGIELPLAVMFGALFLVVFLLIHQLISKVHKLEAQSRRLVQELSLLRAETDADKNR